MTTGSTKRSPPCTTRCPTASAARPRSSTAVDSSASTTWSLRLVEPALTVRTARRQPGARAPPTGAPPALRPASPVADLGPVVADLAGVRAVAQPLVDHVLPDVRGALAESWDAVDHVDHEVEAVEVVQHDHVERRRGRPLLLVAAHVEVRVVRAPVGQAVDQPRVAVVGEDDRPARREERVELGIGQPVRMLALRLQAHQVDDVHDAHLQVGQVPADQLRAATVSSVGTSPAQARTTSGSAFVAARPVPDPDPPRAVGDRLVHRQVVERRLLAGDDHVDVVLRAQAVVGDRQERVRVRRQVDADDLRLLVHDVVDEPGVLVREAVVVLPPDVRGEQVVERRDRPSPRDRRASPSATSHAG